MSLVTRFDEQRAALVALALGAIGHAAGHLRAPAVPPPLVTAGAAPRYRVSDECCDLIAATMDTLPDFDVDLDMLPSSGGFLLLDRPILYAADGLETSRIRAFSWSIGGLRTLNLAAYFEPVERVDGLPPAGLLISYEVMPFRWLAESTDLKAAGDVAVDESARADIALGMRLFAAILAFIAQPLIIEVQPQQPDRGDLRRAGQTAAQFGAVIVYVLRHVRRGSEHNARDVHWVHRWIVRGHWTNQPYGPRNSLRRPLLIAPYLKGPDGAPLIPPRESLTLVAR